MMKTISLEKLSMCITFTLVCLFSPAMVVADNGFTLEKGDLEVVDGTVKAPKFVGAGSTPIGSVTAFMGTSVPENWKEANGESLSRATYPELYAQIGDRYGSDDSLSFNLPDLRGEFIRGWDNGRGVDTDRQLGSYQADELKSHAHTLTINGYWGHNNGGSKTAWSSSNINTGASTATSDSTGGAETRPRNIAVMYIIRVK